MRSLGVIFQPSFPPERMLDYARDAEKAGIAELWLWEDCFRESGIAAASAVLASTEKLRVGIGVLPMPLRNVAITAMELATIDRLFPGRVIGGVGHGVQSWMTQVGARHASFLTLMDEYLPTLRSLLAGDRITIDGRYVRLDDVALDWPPAEPTPVYAGAEGPKTLARAGALADGTIIPSGWSAERLRPAARIVRDAAGERADTHPIVVFLLASFRDHDDDMALEFAPTTAPEHRVSAIGSPTLVAERVKELMDAGATTVALQPRLTEPDLPGFIAGASAVAKLLELSTAS
ncbi:alkanesulfonate monooxygenase SsuD/methylene tetrahydromethanopterin reductase-like flavin-dependent oxidoreductase (luciferase family) [Microbacterium halimionae]|uniref:Alkanesulfonate monooxygenase SsuD/methylene tetrahydromethanopterin reductase-like flavin-dependent oxidoreductase (Luciferase family) n=1 Tax=Microbacterium halimionae TaxID=1526413 RepID=A0A7W3JMC1_9MICO|nr:LLM class flavin-dependent oxidoreductase [Microbacterium halimionae]MBA8815461.1 alkanesulfonate monooxygenase SsuD/methylene tetrahydromethanopterin reductase-like flavin-dependent oxidoreductase (luciferase family) [Microbacterium halimionae]NII95508.1 alkanesulfonate monooxygenase SsuD/methylene tetrahydromethanopterin reductase-like flavin-dependent oxidoreductase (luciferase family) [Microbacterium halimionae]